MNHDPAIKPKQIQSEVDGLLEKHPWLWEEFARHAKHFKACFETWKSFQDGLPPATNAIRERRTRWSERSGPLLGGIRRGKGFRRDTPKGPLCPSTWEIEDKMCCHYVTVGIIRDELGGDRNDKTLVRHILRDQDPARDAYAFTLYLMGDAEFKENPRHEVYRPATPARRSGFEDALEWVSQDVAKIASQRDQQSCSGSPSSPTPPAAICSPGMEGAMNLDEIVDVVHEYAGQIAQQCELLCAGQEAYAGMLREHGQAAFVRQGAANRKLMKQLARQGIKLLPGQVLPGNAQDEEEKAGPPEPRGWVWTLLADYSYLRLEPKHIPHPTCFWRPSRPRNLMAWFQVHPDCAILLPQKPDALTDAELLMLRSFRLATVYDHRLGQTGSNWDRLFLGTPYTGHFKRDKYSDALFDEMRENPRFLADLKWDLNYVIPRLRDGAGKHKEKPSGTSGPGSLAVSGEQAPGSETGKSSDGPNEPLTIAGLVKWLKVRQSARDSEDKGRIAQAGNDLKVHVGSVERMEDLLREFQSQCGPAAHKNKHVEQAIQYATRIRTKEVTPGNWFWDWMVETDGVTHELERGSGAGKGGPNETPGAEEQPNTKRQKPRGKPPLKGRFTFYPGQAKFDDKDLELSTGLPITVLQKLVDSFGVPVSYVKLDGISGKTAEDNLRAAKVAIVASFQKHKVPCEIHTKRKEAYCLCPKAPRRPTRRQRS